MRIAATFLLALLCLSIHAAELDEAAVRKLEEQCELAREARLKPLRDAEIAKCLADKRNDPAYCERFWRDLGEAVRLPNGKMRPRMFNDLPECEAARKARRALSFDD